MLRLECVASEVSLVTAISLAADCVVPRPLGQMWGWPWVRRCFPAHLRLWAQSLLITKFLQQTGRCFLFLKVVWFASLGVYIKCLKFIIEFFLNIQDLTVNYSLTFLFNRSQKLFFSFYLEFSLGWERTVIILDPWFSNNIAWVQD